MTENISQCGQITRYLQILKYHPQEQLMLFPLLYLNSKSCLLQDIFSSQCVSVACPKYHNMDEVR